MTDVKEAVLEELTKRAQGRKLKVGMLCRGNVPLATAIIASGHRTIAMSDRFRILHTIHTRATEAGHRNFIALEVRLDALPIGPGSLDALVLTRGLPSGVEAPTILWRLRHFIRPGGMLIWPHPISDGALGTAGKIMVPLRSGVIGATKRHRLCAWAMEAGFCGICQRTTKGRGPFPWAVTVGVAGLSD